MASALGSLPTLLNYMQNRSYQRDRLAQYDEQLQLQRDRMKADEEYRAADLAARERRDNISDRQTTVAEASNTREQTTFDQDQTTLGSQRLWDRVGPTLGDNLSQGRYGGVSTNINGLNSLYENRPDDLNELVRLSPLFKAANDGVDNYDNVNVRRVTQPDGSFMFAVDVANGNTAGPITEGGSLSDEANVVMIAPEDMVKALNQGLVQTWNDGGSASLASRTRALGDAVLDMPPFRPDMELAAGAALGGQAAEFSQAGIPQGVDAMRGTALNLGEASYDELATILRDNGMTDEEIESTFPRAQTEPQETTTQTEDRTGLSNDLVKLLEARDGASDQPNVRPGQSGMARVSAARNATSNTPEAREQAIQDYAAGLEAEIAALEARGANNPRAQGAFAARIAAKRKDFEFLNPTAVTPQSDLGGIDPPDQTITLGNMRDLIVEKGWKPTEDQVNQTADLLKQAGVQTVAEIPVKLRPRETTMAFVTLAAMDETLNMDQRVELINKLVNLHSSGDTGYGVQQFVDDVQQNTSNATAAGRLAQDIAAFNYRALKDIDTFTAEQNAKVTAMTEKMYEEDANWNDPVITAGFSEMRANYEDLVDPRKKLAVGRALTEGLGVMLSKYANEKNSSWGEFIPNLFRSDPSNDQYINDPMSRIRISPDGKTFGFVDAVGNDGIEEGEIPIAVLLNVLGPEYTKYVSDLAKTRPPMDM